MSLKDILPVQDPNKGQPSYWGLTDGVFLVPNTFPATGQSDSNNSIKFKSIETNSFGNSAIGIKTDGTLWAWGNNSFTSKVNRWVDIKAGQDHIAALDNSGNLFVAGSDEHGQLGLNNSRENLYANVTAGYDAAFAIRPDNTAYVWGLRTFGATGTGTGISIQTESPVQLPGSWSTISSGFHHSLGIKTDGTLWAWGNNSSGQLANSEINTWTAASYPNAGNFYHLIRSDGQLWGVGLNTYGQLGDGTTNEATIPQLVDPGSWTAVGSAYLGTSTSPLTLALAANNNLYWWGRFSNTTSTLLRSTPVLLNVNVASFDITGNQDSDLSTTGFAYIASGELYTWVPSGFNNYGFLGAYDNSGLLSYWDAGKSVVAANFYQDTDSGFPNNITFFGTEVNGEISGLVNSHSVDETNYQINGADLGKVTMSKSGTAYYESFLADNPNGHVPRGNNLYGQHGLNTLDGQFLTSSSYTGRIITGPEIVNYKPTLTVPQGADVPFSNNSATMYPGYNGTLMIDNVYKLYGWGRNREGQFTNNTNPESWTSISVGNIHALGLTSAGKVYSWATSITGLNTSIANVASYSPTRLGRWEGDHYPHPIKHANGVLFSATLISAGPTHNLAVGTDGDLYSWGDNSAGQLGIGITSSFSSRSAPVLVSSAAVQNATITFVHAGTFGDSYCIANSQLYYWGNTDYYFDVPSYYGYYGGGGGY